MERHEPVSVVILTKDEAANIAECLDAVLAQLREGDEAIVVDSASRDATVAICADYATRHPGRVRVHAFPVNVSFGEARNMGIEMARHDVVAFVSADAVPDGGWLAALRVSIANADIVYGRQRHAPTRRNAATVARGLRYHHFERQGDALPETFASNVNAAYRRFCFATLQFDDELPGSEDVAFARRARLAGLRIAYAPDAIVQHKDVASLKAEWRKHLREGAAQAMLRDLLGAPRLHLLWATMVGVLGIAAVALASVWLLALTVLVFFAPTLRRLASPVARRYGARELAGGVALSPIFDMAFVGSYLARRATRRG
ncbi:MAG TPA: glycosyltransferase [Candidatus Thermoplasmatota archaeon]|nr:glycosyltransferase [Candidatus Thermoplasmatota archaeon]